MLNTSTVYLWQVPSTSYIRSLRVSRESWSTCVRIPRATSTEPSPKSCKPSDQTCDPVHRSRNIGAQARNCASPSHDKLQMAALEVFAQHTSATFACVCWKSRIKHLMMKSTSGSYFLNLNSVTF